MIARARAMIPVLAERAPQGERERRLPKRDHRRHAGGGLLPRAAAQALGRLRARHPRPTSRSRWRSAEGDMSVAWVYGVIGVHPWLLALYDDRAAQDIWGEDDSTLICSSLMPVGTATPVEGGFRLSGRWKYSSGCEHCAWAFLGGTAPSGAMPTTGASFLLPRSDYEIVDTWHVSGLKAHRQPRHRRQGRVRARPIARRSSPTISAATARAWRSTPRRSTGCRSARCSSAASRPARSARCRACSTPFSPTASSASTAPWQPRLGGSAGAAHLRRDRGRDRRDEDHPASQLPQPGSLCGARRDAAARRCGCSTSSIPRWWRSAAACWRARLFKATGAAGLYADQPFGRILADINTARQHISNQFDATGRNWGAVLFGVNRQQRLHALRNHDPGEQ